MGILGLRGSQKQQRNFCLFIVLVYHNHLFIALGKACFLKICTFVCFFFIPFSFYFFFLGGQVFFFSLLGLLAQVLSVKYCTKQVHKASNTFWAASSRKVLPHKKKAKNYSECDTHTSIVCYFLITKNLYRSPSIYMHSKLVNGNRYP